MIWCAARRVRRLYGRECELAVPVVTQCSGQNCTQRSAADHEYGRQSPLEDRNKAAEEYDDRGEVLDNDSRIGDEGPEFVRTEPGISLQLIKKCVLVGIVVGIILLDPEQLLPLLFRPLA